MSAWGLLGAAAGLLIPGGSLITAAVGGALGSGIDASNAAGKAAKQQAAANSEATAANLQMQREALAQQNAYINQAQGAIGSGYSKATDLQKATASDIADIQNQALGRIEQYQLNLAAQKYGLGSGANAQVSNLAQRQADQTQNLQIGGLYDQQSAVNTGYGQREGTINNTVRDVTRTVGAGYGGASNIEQAAANQALNYQSGGYQSGANTVNQAARQSIANQMAGTNKNIGALQEGFAVNAALQSPWYDAGQSALNRLSAGLEQGGEFTKSFAPSDIYTDPSYAWRLSQGQKALEASQAAKGIMFTGGAQAALSDYAQKQAATEYQAAYDRFRQQQGDNYNRVSSMAGTGLNVGQNIGGAASTLGSNIGSAYQNLGNNIGTTLTNAGNTTAGYQVNQGTNAATIATNLGANQASNLINQQNAIGQLQTSAGQTLADQYLAQGQYNAGILGKAADVKTTASQAITQAQIDEIKNRAALAGQQVSDQAAAEIAYNQNYASQNAQLLGNLGTNLSSLYTNQATALANSLTGQASANATNLVNQGTTMATGAINAGNIAANATTAQNQAINQGINGALGMGMAAQQQQFQNQLLANQNAYLYGGGYGYAPTTSYPAGANYSLVPPSTGLRLY